MSDPKYNVYAGELRFDDDNIVDVNLEPDTENITVRLNGAEITGGSELPEVDGEDNGKVLTVVSGEWAAATPATPPAELPAVSGSDNGDVLTVVEGVWAKAAPAAGGGAFVFDVTFDDHDDPTTETTYAQILSAYTNNQVVICRVLSEGDYILLYLYMYEPTDGEQLGYFLFQHSHCQQSGGLTIEFTINDLDSVTHESNLTFSVQQYSYSAGMS